jgi:hypothetical protein
MRKDIPLMIGLGLLAAPRAVLHDLDLIHERTGLNTLLVFVPLLIWVVVAVTRPAAPVRLLLGAGAVYGVCLAVIHNALWNGETTVPEPVARIAMTLSSLATGLAVGAICAGVAWLILRFRSGPATRNPATPDRDPAVRWRPPTADGTQPADRHPTADNPSRADPSRADPSRADPPAALTPQPR